MLDLKQWECESWNIKFAGEGLFMLGLKPVRKIVYARLWGSSKDCLSRETDVTFLTLRSRSIPKWFEHAKRFHLSARQLHDKCSASVSVEIIYFEHLQQGPYEKLNPGIFFKITYSQVHRRFQPWSIFGRWSLCSVLQVEFSHSHITSHTLFAKVFKYLRRKWLRKFRFAK